MKQVLFTLSLIGLCLSAVSQPLYRRDSLFLGGKTFTFHTGIDSEKSQWPRIVAGCGAMFIAGCGNGLNETISFHYSAFKKRHPGANDDYWNPEVSWRNKYAGGDPENGPKFTGSTGPLVWTTDAYHLTNTIRTTFIVGGAITIGAGPKRPTWRRIAEAGAGMLSYWAGNYLIYDIIYKP